MYLERLLYIKTQTWLTSTFLKSTSIYWLNVNKHLFAVFNIDINNF